MTKQQSQALRIKQAEAYVRDALSKASKKPVTEKTVREVAKKVSKAIPQFVEHRA